MQNYWIRLVVFLVLNFGALAIGSALMGEGPIGSWYQELVRAPWEPPGWVFGVTWTFIMICLSVFMASIYDSKTVDRRRILVLYGVQLLLNIFWNPLFFKWHLPIPALLEITCLLILVFTLFRESRNAEPKILNLLLLPYIIWLCIAISLNAYIIAMN